MYTAIFSKLLTYALKIWSKKKKFENCIGQFIIFNKNIDHPIQMYKMIKNICTCDYGPAKNVLSSIES